MPAAHEMTDDHDPLKLLLLGDSKAGKTDFLLRAAELGFNILYINGDVGARTLRKMIQTGRLSHEAAQRIFYMQANDFINDRGQYVAQMADFFVKFSTSGKVLWNDTLSRMFSSLEYKPEEGHVIWEIYPSRMRTNTLLLLDSWTSLVTSVLNWKADALGEDLGDIEKIARDMYAGCGHKLTHFLQLLKATPCHLGVIGHPREYIKLEKPDGQKVGKIQEKDMKIEWTKMVPVSSSNPHALTMGKNFTDIGWIELNRMGERIIDFRPSDDKVIGGALTVHGKVDEYNFLRLVQESGGSKPTDLSTDSWLKRYGPGEYEPLVGKPAALGAKKDSAPKLSIGLAAGTSALSKA